MEHGIARSALDSNVVTTRRQPIVSSAQPKINTHRPAPAARTCTCFCEDFDFLGLITPLAPSEMRIWDLVIPERKILGTCYASGPWVSVNEGLETDASEPPLVPEWERLWSL